MSRIVEVDVLKNWTLSVDHFYSMLKSNLGSMSSNGKYQLQMTAIPLDINDSTYHWFSRGNINSAFDVSLEPVPVSEDLAGGLEIGTKLSEEYGSFLETAVTLVEEAELPEDVVIRIARINTDIENLGEEEFKLMKKLSEKWKLYCEIRMIEPGDVSAFLHWKSGQSDSTDLIQVRKKRNRKVATKWALRSQYEYENPDHKALIDAWTTFIGPSATLRYPRFEDTAYGDESKKFSVQYFANLDAHDSEQFVDKYMMTPMVALKTIESSTFGSFSSVINKESKASESVSTDWSYSGSVSYGPFKAKHSIDSKEEVEEEFGNVTDMTVSVESLIAIPFLANTWFTPSIFKNPLISSNPNLFERWLGSNGTLKIIPTHLVVCRGFKLTFTNKQAWEYDYEKDFSAGGGGSASVFGIKFGARGKYHKHVERQNVEKRGHELVFDDGAKNIRILGYHTVSNQLFSDWDEWEKSFNRAEEEGDSFIKDNNL